MIKTITHMLVAAAIGSLLGLGFGALVRDTSLGNSIRSAFAGDELDRQPGFDVGAE